jgi:adenylate cyclase
MFDKFYRSYFRRFVFPVIVLGVLAAICAPLFADRVDHDGPRVVDGQVSFAGVGAPSAPTELVGNWTLVWHGDSARPATNVRTAIKVPGIWTGLKTSTGFRLPETGAATLQVTLMGLPPGPYEIYFPIIYSASRVWVDNTVVSSAGILGTNAATTRTVWRGHEIPFYSAGKPIQIRVDMAVFHHRTNGLEGAPLIGARNAMKSWIALAWAKDLFFDISLVTVLLFALVVFLYRPSDLTSLFLAISYLCFLPFSLIFGHDNLMAILFPDISFNSLLSIQYISGIFVSLFFLLYTDSLFPRERNKFILGMIISLFTISLILMSYIAGIGNTLLASHVYPYVTLFMFSTMIYVVGVVATASFKGRDGSVVFLMGVVIFAVTFWVGALVGNGVVDRDRVPGINLTPIGMPILMFAQIIILAERWSVAIRRAEDTSADLRRLMDVSSSITSEVRLDRLLAQIVEAVTKFVNADRSSLFLYDPDTHKLASSVAEGLGRGITFSADTGIAGECFQTGAAVLVNDAYGDARFNRAIDDATGYRTNTILAMPLVTRDGRKIGVMQALNRIGGGGFQRTDVSRISAFAAHAAVAIDNAKLFADVNSARVYSDSILGSMSNGLVTLDRHGGFVRANPAAGRILDLDDLNDGSNADFLAMNANCWLQDEIDVVRGNGEARFLTDADIVTRTARVASVNISLVPLLVEEQTEGMLLLIDDISQEKRLEGVMRRFLTQRVMDQVLEAGEDLLFGTACTASVLFVDVRGFTTMTEKMTARETVEMLNELFAELYEAVASSDGVLDKYIGDAIMAVFGAPLTSGRDAQNAVNCALLMARRLGDLNARRNARGDQPLRIGIGVSTGELVAGTIGSPKRMDYTVIGDTVNLSARLQDLTKQYNATIIVCSATARAIGATYPMKHLDDVVVRGRTRVESIYEIVAAPAVVDVVAQRVG